MAAMAPPLMTQGWGEEVGRGGGGGDQDVSLWRTASRQTTSLPVMCPFGRIPANRGSRRLLASSCSTPGLTGAIWNRGGSLRHLRAPPENVPGNICKLTPRLAAKWPPEEPFEEG